MKNILMRIGKNPFTIKNYKLTYEKNILGINSGNLIFAYSVYKSLYTDNNKIYTHGYTAKADKVDEINEKYDMLIAPFANAFRPSFKKHLIEWIKLVNKLKIPVVVPGIGAQVGLNGKFDRLNSIDTYVYDFVKAILNKSATIGVRGEITYNYLKKLGFPDNSVDIIGCPSMFWNEDKLHVVKKTPTLTKKSKFALNISPYLKKIAPFIKYHCKKYNDIVYIPQDTETLKKIIYGENSENLNKKSDIPIYLSHELFKKGKVKYFIDPSTWMDFLSTRELSFGTRSALGKAKKRIII